jgi:hypothetical protein
MQPHVRESIVTPADGGVVGRLQLPAGEQKRCDRLSPSIDTITLQSAQKYQWCRLFLTDTNRQIKEKSEIIKKNFWY